MLKMTDDVALWEKYKRESVPQKIPIERFCVMNGYTYKQFEQWYNTDRIVSFTPLELSDPVTSLDQSANFQTKCLRLVLSNGIEIRQKNINLDSVIWLLRKLSV